MKICIYDTKGGGEKFQICRPVMTGKRKET